MFTNFEDFLERATRNLDAITGPAQLQEEGDQDFLSEEEAQQIRPAGVLIPLIPRPQGVTVLLTLRPTTMPSHAGQVAFPGGKVDPIDADAVDAALREAHEEVGVNRETVRLLGRSANYVTGTRYRITPVLGVLPADFEPVPDAYEVDKVFETPLSFLMNPVNHKIGEAVYRGKTRKFYEMPYNGYRIWGVTAGIIRKLYKTLYV